MGGCGVGSRVRRVQLEAEGLGPLDLTLRPGEVVKVKLSGIGTLENPVTGPPKYV